MGWTKVPSTPGKRPFHKKALALLDTVPYRWVLAYVLLAGVGGFVSDWLTSKIPNPAHAFRISVLKNAIFVLVTAAFLYLLSRREVALLKRSHLILEEERVFHQALLQSLAEGIVATDAQGATCVFNRAAENLLGTPDTLLEGISQAGCLFLADGITPMDRRKAPLARAMGGESIHNFEIVLRPPVGLPRTLLLHADPIHQTDGRPLGAVAALLDVTETRFFLHQAFHDPLTGLPNRALLMDRLIQALKSLERRPRHLALLFLDLDDFKRVNDRLGHGAGDHLLMEVGARLSDCLRPEDTLARMGGDEFVLLLDEIEDAEAALKIARRVSELLAEPFQLGQEGVRISASVGVALTHTLMSAEQLLYQADMAMYGAKRMRKGSFELFASTAREAQGPTWGYP